MKMLTEERLRELLREMYSRGRADELVHQCKYPETSALAELVAVNTTATVHGEIETIIAGL